MATLFEEPMEPTPQPQQVPETYGPPPRYQPPYYRPPVYGPTIGERISRSFGAKIGIGILIVSIIGLILALLLPWVMYDYHPEDSEGWSAFYDHELEKMSGDDTAPENFGGGVYQDFYKDRSGMSIFGFILGIIFGCILIGFGMIDLSRYSNLTHTTNTIMGALLLFPAILCILSATSFMNLMIMSIHNSGLFGSDVSVIPLAGFVVLVFGIIILGMAIALMRREIRSITPSKVPPRAPPVQPTPPYQPQPPQYPPQQQYPPSQSQGGGS